MEKINVTVTYEGETQSRKLNEGTILRDFVFRFLEENLLDDGCFVDINGVNMTHNIQYVLQDNDEIVIHPMVLSGG